MHGFHGPHVMSDPFEFNLEAVYGSRYIAMEIFNSAADWVVLDQI